MMLAWVMTLMAINEVADPLDPVQAGMWFIGIILTSGTLGVVLKHLHDRKKLPIERASLLATASKETVGSVLEALESLRTQQQRTERRLRRVERELYRIKSAYQALLLWARFLVEQWATVRQSATPPVIPAHAVMEFTEHDEDTGENEQVDGQGTN